MYSKMGQVSLPAPNIFLFHKYPSVLYHHNEINLLFFLCFNFFPFIFIRIHFFIFCSSHHCKNTKYNKHRNHNINSHNCNSPWRHLIINLCSWCSVINLRLICHCIQSIFYSSSKRCNTCCCIR